MKIDGFSDAAMKFRVMADDFDEVADKVDRHVDEGTKEAAKEVRNEARRRVPVKSGDLRNSIRISQARNGRWLVGSDEPHARPIEMGRGPIVADDAGSLRFMIDGEVFYRQSVGPAEAQPFLRPALVSNEDTLSDRIERKIRDLFRGVF